MLEDPTKIENQEMFYKKKRKGNTLIHPLWLSTESHDKPINFVFRLANSGDNFAARANSVVQTGV
jgi:hypothetical protein